MLSDHSSAKPRCPQCSGIAYNVVKNVDDGKGVSWKCRPCGCRVNVSFASGMHNGKIYLTRFDKEMKNA